MYINLKVNGNKKYYTALAVQFFLCFILAFTVYLSLNNGITDYVRHEENTVNNNENVSTEIRTVSDKINIDKSAKGGVDIDISKNDINEGIFYDEYKLPFDIICPVDDYFVSSDFGERENPLSGGESIHIGIDLASANGSEIHSAYDGTVRKSDYSEGYGNYIVVTHPDGIETLYAHCSEIVAKKGDKVKTGDVIALVGSTGNSTGPHLHFEIRYRDVKLNPAFALDL